MIDIGSLDRLRNEVHDDIDGYREWQYRSSEFSGNEPQLERCLKSVERSLLDLDLLVAALQDVRD